MEKAASKGVKSLVRSDVCSLPFKDGAFDYSLSVHLIHLIPQWRTALREIGRVTRKGLISIVSEKELCGAEEMRRLYGEWCKRLGFEVRFAGPAERELPELLRPDSTLKLAVHEQTFDVQKMLDNYEARLLSEQWEVPDNVHMGAVNALRKVYGNVDAFVGREEIFLITWSADRVRAIGRRPD
jgi:ubiquinone/menaquinone biosynthesis C-methylase UbiE